jgi:hypothetical protein
MATSNSWIGWPADGIAAFSGRSLSQNMETSRELKLARTINGVAECFMDALGNDEIFQHIQRLHWNDGITKDDVTGVLQNKWMLAMAILILQLSTDVRSIMHQVTKRSR